MSLPEKLGAKVQEKVNGLNGAIRIAGIVSVPGALSLYLVWYLADSVGAKLDRIIVVLESIARAINAPVGR